MLYAKLKKYPGKWCGNDATLKINFVSDRSQPAKLASFRANSAFNYREMLDVGHQ